MIVKEITEQQTPANQYRGKSSGSSGGTSWFFTNSCISWTVWFWKFLMVSVLIFLHIFLKWPSTHALSAFTNSSWSCYSNVFLHLCFIQAQQYSIGLKYEVLGGNFNTMLPKLCSSNSVSLLWAGCLSITITTPFKLLSWFKLVK